MKHNGTQGTYHSVPQNLQSEEAPADQKKEQSHESVIESDPSAKASEAPPKELQDIADEGRKPMSPLRKVCFVLSILQCVLFIVAFGWLIPCKIPRHTDGKHYIQNWELNFYNEDFVTSIAVTGFKRKPIAAVLGFRSLSNESLYGIRAVNAFDGSSMWEINTKSKPENIVCSSLDDNSNNEADCVVTSNTGDMFAISANDGKTVWNMLENEKAPDIQLVSKPVIGSSCHNENTPYIYAAVQDKFGTHHFITVSSSSGRIVKIYELPECAALPENMMLRASKSEHEIMNPVYELVMTCKNEAGNGIIYTSNADEFCKNESTLPFNEIFFKLGIVDGAKFPLHAELLKSNEGDNLAVLIDDERIKVYSEEKEEETQFSVDRGVTIKNFVVGHFTNSSLVNLVVLTNAGSASSNALLLLDNTTSHSLRSIPVENGTGMSMFTVHNAFNSFDTVLLKLVVQTNDIEDSDFNATNLKHFEVKYMILECFEMGTFRVVSEDLITASCNDGNCMPDVFQEDTVTLADIDNDGTEELIYFSRKMLPSMSVQSVMLQLKRLTEPLAKSCNACHC